MLDKNDVLICVLFKRLNSSLIFLNKIQNWSAVERDWILIIRNQNISNLNDKNSYKIFVSKYHLTTHSNQWKRWMDFFMAHLPPLLFPLEINRKVPFLKIQNFSTRKTSVKHTINAHNRISTHKLIKKTLI